MNAYSTIKTPVLSFLAGLNFEEGSEDWLVCRLGAHRSVPEKVWDQYQSDTPSFRVLSKFARISPDQKLSRRQVRVLKRFVDTTMAAPIHSTGSKVGPAVNHLADAGKWELCNSILSCLDYPILHQEAGHILKGIFSDGFSSKASPVLVTLANSFGKYIQSECSEIIVNGPDTTGKYLDPTSHITNTIDLFKWCLETLDFPEPSVHTTQLSRLVIDTTAAATQVKEHLTLNYESTLPWLRAASHKAGLSCPGDHVQPARKSTPPSPPTM